MAYKAFNTDFTCNGKQYEENTTYEESGNKICEAGVMHYCENPFDVLDYYPLVNENGEILEFAEVEPLGKIFKKGAEILGGLILISIGIKILLEHILWKNQSIW